MPILVGDLSPERIAQIEHRMLPGQSSRIGFLTQGERLADIIARDEKTCADRGITPRQIADRLETLVGRAKRRVGLALRRRERGDEVDGFMNGRGGGVLLEGFRITGIHYRGLQDCPFEETRGATCEPFIYSAGNYSIEHVDTKREIRFPGLIIHLAREHHFFEGSVTYRLEPSEAIDVLGLERDVDYTPKYATQTIWHGVMATGDPYEKVKKRSVIDVSIDDARQVVEVVPGIRIYVKESRCVLIAEREYLLEEPLLVDGTAWPAERFRPGTCVYARGEERYVL